MKKIIFLFLIIASAIFSDFSEGFRIGVVDKFSKKGIVCKSWEGQLVMDGQGNYGKSRLFKFSVTDENIAKKINETAGMKVRLEYSQKKFFSTKCSGDTNYFIVGVKELK
jgi:hypothetical protein